MGVGAWCGRCGESFGLVEAVDGDVAGSCPRCGVSFGPSYTAVLVTAVRRLLAAADDLMAAGGQLRDVAPRLHVDAKALCIDLETTLDH